MKRILGVETICGPDWETSSGPCLIKNAFEADSGEYWCEADRTVRSKSVHISVTGRLYLSIIIQKYMDNNLITLKVVGRDQKLKENI